MNVVARNRRRLAASFVVTVAVIPACQKPSDQGSRTPETSSCEPPDCHMNPPPLQPRPTASVATSPTATTAAPSATAPPSASGPTRPPVADAVPLEPAPKDVKLCSDPKAGRPCVDKSDDGTCRLLPSTRPCPPTMKCNPPPIRRVACPDATR